MEKIIIISNFSNDTRTGFLKILEDNYNHCIVNNRLYSIEGYNIKYLGENLYISKNKINNEKFEGWQIFLLSDQITEGNNFDISDSDTYIMYHTTPSIEIIEGFLKGKSYKHKKKGAHEPKDHNGYPIINYLLEAYDCDKNNFDERKYDEAIKKFIEWFNFNEELEANLELLHQCLTPDELNKVTWGENGTIIIDNNNLSTKIEVNGAKNKFDELKNKSDGPFGTGYIEALKDLRKALLPD